MKKAVLFFCFAMLSILAFAQPVSQYLGSPTTAVKTRGIHIIDSVLSVPKRLSALFKDTGSVYYRIADSSIQVWTGSQWLAIGGNDLSAVDGLTNSGALLKLGQDSAQAGNPAALQSTREIPLNGKHLWFSGDEGNIMIGQAQNQQSTLPYRHARLSINDTSTRKMLLKVGPDVYPNSIHRSALSSMQVYGLDTIKGQQDFLNGVAKGLFVQKREYIDSNVCYNCASGQSTNTAIYGELAHYGRDTVRYSNPGGDLIQGVTARLYLGQVPGYTGITRYRGNDWRFDGQYGTVSVLQTQNSNINASSKVHAQGYYGCYAGELIMKPRDTIDNAIIFSTGGDYIENGAKIKKYYGFRAVGGGLAYADSSWGIYQDFNPTLKSHNHLAYGLHIGPLRTAPVDWASLDVEGRVNIVSSDADSGIVIRSTESNSSHLLRIESTYGQMLLQGSDIAGITFSSAPYNVNTTYNIMHQAGGKRLIHQLAPGVTPEATGWMTLWAKNAANNWGRLLMDNGHWAFGPLGTLGSTKPDNRYQVSVYSSLYVDSLIALNPRSAAPTSPVNGMMYYNSSDNKFYGRAAGSWVDLGETGGGGGLSDPGANGILARTALNTTTARTITGAPNLITVTNGDGVSGNPTIDVGPNIVQTTGAQTIAGIKSFTDRMEITKGTGITPDVNNVLYLGRNEPGNFYPLGIFEDATNDGYAQFAVWGKNRKWNFGVGNGPSNFFGVQDKFYVLDATSNNVRFVIDDNGRTGMGGITSPTAFLHVPAGTTTAASLRIPETSSSPTSPNAGEIWNNEGKLTFRTGIENKVLNDFDGGSYIPTFSNLGTGVSSVTLPPGASIKWQRVGKTVSIWGNITPIFSSGATGDTRNWSMSLPPGITAVFTQGQDAAGIANCGWKTTRGAIVQADANNDIIGMSVEIGTEGYNSIIGYYFTVSFQIP